MKNKRGFSLAEMMTVLAILGIGIGLFYSIFIVNWIAFEKELTLADLQLEADQTFETISIDLRYGKSFTVDEDGKELVVTLPDDTTSTFTFTEEGKLERERDEETTTLSERIDRQESLFIQFGNYVQIHLVLFDTVFGDRIALTVSTKLTPRNAL